MAKSKVSNIGKKRIGRPPVGAIPVLVRIPPAEMLPIDDWIGRQKVQTSRPEAIRRLIELGLKAKPAAKAVGKPGRRLRAQELAARAIQGMIDPATPPEEQAQRRRRLTKGPSEFREDRVDLPKAKGR